MRSRSEVLAMLGTTALLAGCSSGSALVPKTDAKPASVFTSQFTSDGKTLTILVAVDGRPAMSLETTERGQRVTDLTSHRVNQRDAPPQPTFQREACRAMPLLAANYAAAGQRLNNDTLALVSAIGVAAFTTGVTLGAAFFVGLGVIVLYDNFDRSSREYYALQAQVTTCQAF